VPVPGGYRVTGRWSWGSGIRHAEWVFGNTLVVRDGEGTPEMRFCLFPIERVEVHDNWNVMGMRGTGSCDYSVSDLFVPEGFTYDFARSEPLRGGPLYRLGWPGYVINVIAAFALGVGRRALDTIIDLAQSKRRGYGKKMPLAERAVFQRVVGENDLRLRAARALMVEVLEKAWATVCSGHPPEPVLQAEMRCAATFVVDVALEVSASAFRYGGGTAVFLPHILQRCLRDIYTAASHQIVSDTVYEIYGQFLLGLPGADPMA
jgi:alkylation response protein AidB-like acyl-CoA dehydrogenase